MTTSQFSLESENSQVLGEIVFTSDSGERINYPQVLANREVSYLRRPVSVVHTEFRFFDQLDTRTPYHPLRKSKIRPPVVLYIYHKKHSPGASRLTKIHELFGFDKEYLISYINIVGNILYVTSDPFLIGLYKDASSNSPSFKELRFGIEFEFVSPLEPGRLHHQLLTQSLLDDTWQIKEDGSIVCDNSDPEECENPNHTDCAGHDYEYPVEIATPAMPYNSKSFEAIRRLCSVIRKSGGYTNTSCGLHIHVSHPHMRDLQKLYNMIERIEWFWEKFGSDFTKMLHESRQDNDYCKGLASKSDKYCMISLESLHRHGTVEYRAHHGTLNDVAVINWLKFCVRLTTWALSGKGFEEPFSLPITASGSVDRISEVVRLPKAVKEYLKTMDKARVLETSTG